MKAILEFNLPKDISNYNMCTNAPRMYSALWEIKQYVRGLYKYQDYECDKTNDVVAEIYKRICDECGDLLEE